jgi:hypothetical protein
LDKRPWRRHQGGWSSLPQHQQPGPVHWTLFIETMYNLNIEFIKARTLFHWIW